ncbi:Os01g0728000, partial [Oryza sativa Japonica Group]
YLVPPAIHTLRLGVCAAAGYRSVARCSSLSSFNSLKYVYSWLIACYCTCSKHIFYKDAINFIIFVGC